MTILDVNINSTENRQTLDFCQCYQIDNHTYQSQVNTGTAQCGVREKFMKSFKVFVYYVCNVYDCADLYVI